MPEVHGNATGGLMREVVRALLKVSTFQFAVVFLVVAVIVSVMIVLTIDLLWDGRLNAELEFAGIVTPFLDGLLLVVFTTAMLREIREEVQRRRAAEAALARLNEELEQKVRERTRALLAAQDELVRKEKLAVLGQVAGNVGHELRNPLGVMSNAVYFLQTVLDGADAPVKEYLTIISDEIGIAERIVADLLDSVRTKPPQPETVRVAELIDRVLRKCAVPDKFAIVRDIPADLPPLQVDPFQIAQVFRNLIANSLDAMPDGGTLELQASLTADRRLIAVRCRDSGSGIAPDHLPRLFQPLFTTKARGTGLGLAVVKNLTEANGGSVAVSSRVNAGTEFVISLPVHPDH